MNSKESNSSRQIEKSCTPTFQWPRARRCPRLAALALCASLALLLAPVASAQRLDGLWFKLYFSGKGRTLSPAGEVRRMNITAPVYLHLTSTNTHQYQARFWTKTEAGWINSNTSGMQTIGPNENFVSDWGGTMHGPDGSSIHVYCTFYISIRTNRLGAVVGSTFDGGGEIDEGQLAVVNNGATQYNSYYGTCTLKGTVVKESKLPFRP